MTLDTFRRTVRLAISYNQEVYLGGGEPTLHPQLWEFIGLSLKANALLSQQHNKNLTGLVTNGTNRDISLRLAALADIGALSVRLSNDAHHDHTMVDSEVREAFKAVFSFTSARVCSSKECVDSIVAMIPLGRAKRHHYTKEFPPDGCGAEVHVDPDGRVWRCSCRKERIGNVRRGILPQFREMMNGLTDTHALGCSSLHVPLASVRYDRTLELDEQCWAGPLEDFGRWVRGHKGWVFQRQP
jgi:hypothetical protein